MATRVNGGRFTKIIYLLHSQNPLLDAKILEISCTLCQIIARFVTNFVPIATRVSRGKIRLAAFAGPSLKTPPIDANISQVSLTQAEL